MHLFNVNMSFKGIFNHITLPEFPSKVVMVISKLALR